MTQQITFYTFKLSPFAHRVQLALRESGLSYEHYEVDLMNKPEWYTLKVNPAGKVPALTYGGSKVPPDHPSPESVKITESIVILEFIADLSGSLLPKEPVLRARARFFIEKISSIFIPAWYVVVRGENTTDFLAGIEVIQGLLPAEGYAVGEYSIADAAITPFLARAEVNLGNDIGAYDEGAGTKAWHVLQTDPKFARFRKYFADLKVRKSFRETFDPVYVLNEYKKRYPALRAKRLAAKKDIKD